MTDHDHDHEVDRRTGADRREESRRSSEATEDRIVRQAQAWLIPILLALVGTLVYPMIVSISDSADRIALEEKETAVHIREMKHLEYRVNQLEIRLSKQEDILNQR